MVEAAEMMGMHPNSILWNIRKKYLPATSDGYRYLIHPDDFRRWRELYYDFGEDEDD